MPISPKQFDAEYYSSGNYGKYSEDVFTWVPQLARKINMYLKNTKNASIVDIGCAQGYLLDYLHKGYGYKVRGLEYSQYARQNAVESVRSDIEQGSVLDRSAFKASSFDGVICLDVVEYLTVEETKLAIKNLVRWSKKYIFFAAIYKHSSQSSQENNPDPYRITTLTQKEYIDIFKKNKMRFVQKFYSDSGGDVLIFEKIK